jgi:dihydrofolate synthase / folylpolyglutamate synthase
MGMDYKSILQELYSLENPRIVLRLDRVHSLLEKVGNPQKKIKCFHVAGTNGKGSTCAMIQSVIMEEGFKVGMYTSPHLKKFNERIRVNEALISDRKIVDFYSILKPYIRDQTFFEVTTVIAFLHFAEENVDFAVIEVGLGGRLDATNVITPLISAITNISLEHTHLLGRTESRIACEKAGIIKENVPIVTGAKGKALEVIKKTAVMKNAPLTLVKKHPDINFRFLNGSFQQKNKDLVMTVFEGLGKKGILKLGKKTVLKGIKNTKWPGRMQFIGKNLLVDGAHNEDGMNALAKELRAIRKQKKVGRFIFVVGIQSTKNIDSMLKTISLIASAVVFTRSDNEKACSPALLKKQFSKFSKAESFIEANPKKAVKKAKQLAKSNDFIVVCGSLYMIGEVI